MSQQNVKTAPHESKETSGEHNVFAKPGTLCAWDEAINLNGKWVTRCSGRTLPELQRDYPDMAMMTRVEFTRQANAAARTEVREISEERFIDQLEVLPPMCWVRGDATQSFKSCEMYAEDVTTIFVQIKGRFFEFRDVFTLSHQDILARIDAEIFGKTNTTH